MRKLLLMTIIGLTSVFSVSAQQSASLSIIGPASWTPGTVITLSVQDTFANLSGGGASGLTYLLEVNSAIAPFLSITGLNHFTFAEGFNGPIPVLMIRFNIAGSPGFMREGVDLGGSNNPLTIIPNGSYHVTDITFTLAAGAPNGTYTLRTTPQSIQTDGNFLDVPIPQASFVFTVVPEPSALALLGIGAIGSGVFIYRRRKTRTEESASCYTRRTRSN